MAFVASGERDQQTESKDGKFIDDDDIPF